MQSLQDNMLEQNLLDRIKTGRYTIYGNGFSNLGIITLNEKTYKVSWVDTTNGIDYFYAILNYEEVVPIKTINTEYVTKEQAQNYIGMAGFGYRIHVVRDKYIIDEDLIKAVKNVS